jgi:hypothetical protein
MTARAGILVIVLGFTAFLAGDAMTVGVERQPSGAADTATGSATWTEVKWPFPLDQWGTGRAFQCRDCGIEMSVYVRPKLGFCNCTTGVSDDAELDRVGDLELLSDKFEGQSDGRPITVGWMKGRSRPYQVAIPYAARRPALAIAFNDKCDVVVATVVANEMQAAERAALDFLNRDVVLRWVERELGL